MLDELRERMRGAPMEEVRTSHFVIEDRSEFTGRGSRFLARAAKIYDPDKMCCYWTKSERLAAHFYTSYDVLKMLSLIRKFRDRFPGDFHIREIITVA
jgi:hypothetical protein